MKIKEGFILRKVGKQYVVVATGKASKEFHGMIRLNASAASLFNRLKKESEEGELIQALMEEYGISEEIAKEDTEHFLVAMKEAGALV